MENIKTAIKLFAEISNKLSLKDIKYLLYGSVAYFLYTRDEQAEINDIDIIVKEKDFDKIMEIFDNFELPYKFFRTKHNLHANHLNIKMNDGKPFDISFDSFEYYFKDHGIRMGRLKKFIISETEIKTVILEDLIKIYKLGVCGRNLDKIKEYERKLCILELIE
ncbi:hypothetical protein GF362_05130 [Candidatus Dojkabacteria bacterium]|nr:hypothetical protein [Candidatus Dojkabacteria bacterium]